LTENISKSEFPQMYLYKFHIMEARISRHIRLCESFHETLHRQRNKCKSCELD